MSQMKDATTYVCMNECEELRNEVTGEQGRCIETGSSYSRALDIKGHCDYCPCGYPENWQPVNEVINSLQKYLPEHRKAYHEYIRA